MNIRKAIRSDISVIVDFQVKMALETEQVQLDVSLLQKGVEAVFDDPSKGFYIVTEDDQRVIASMLLTPEWSDWRNSFFLWIQSLFVMSEYRKMGVFRKMYDFTQKMVNGSDDYAGIKLYVDKRNIKANDTYRNVGMLDNHYDLFEWNKKEI